MTRKVLRAAPLLLLVVSSRLLGCAVADDTGNGGNDGRASGDVTAEVSGDGTTPPSDGAPRTDAGPGLDATALDGNMSPDATTVTDGQSPIDAHAGADALPTDANANHDAQDSAVPPPPPPPVDVLVPPPPPPPVDVVVTPPPPPVDVVVPPPPPPPVDVIVPPPPPPPVDVVVPPPPPPPPGSGPGDVCLPSAPGTCSSGGANCCLTVGSAPIGICGCRVPVFGCLPCS